MHRSFYILSILSIVILSSCEKVIDLDLNEVEKKYVIEAILQDQAGTSKVMISQTKNFDEDNTFPGISGATVTITESGGATTTLTELSQGVYQNAGLAGTSGKTYTLNVTINGQSFSAVSTMPVKVNLDTIYVTNEVFFGEERKTVNAVFDDPPGLGNSYRFVQYVNGLKEDQIMYRNDDYSDDRVIAHKLFYFTDNEDDPRIIKSGDQIVVDFNCIDKNIYKYWFSMDRSSTGIAGQATPTNPVTNLQGGALGYFSAQTIETKMMVVP
jgi:hypothetical protein